MPEGVETPGWVRLIAALGVIHVVLALPADPAAWDPSALLVLPTELVVLVATLGVVAAGRRRTVRRVAVMLIAAALLLKLADAATLSALGRPFDPVFDLHLAGAGWTLLTGAVGTGAALGYALAGFVASILVIVVVARALAVIGAWLETRPRGRGRRGAAAGLGVLVAGATVAGVGTGNAALLAAKLRAGADAVASMRAFATAAADDDLAERATDELFRELQGRDVLFLFVESYGRSAIEAARYASTIRRRLAGFEDSLAAVGYGARSGWLTSPVKGGQSWLAHATLLTGLEIDHQQRYASLLASERRSLVHGFARAGWRTVAVMPAITMPWPQGVWFGYDAVYSAGELGYAGAPFNWVTVPDQYTLSALERLELARTDRPPVMAEVALISSHAPWTPIPPVLDWAEVGDGSVFTPYARAGDPPAVVWRDAARVRRQYLKAVDYALANLASYVAAHGRDDLVLVVVGDHQPAPLVTGEGAGRDVPMHVVAAPEVLVELDGWGWSEGMTPAADLPAWPMAAFRDHFVDAFSF